MRKHCDHLVTLTSSLTHLYNQYLNLSLTFQKCFLHSVAGGGGGGEKKEVTLLVNFFLYIFNGRLVDIVTSPSQLLVV